MPNYIELIILIAPGFIAQRTSKWVGNFSDNKTSQFDSIMEYFSYSLFTILTSTFFLSIINVFINEPFTFDYQNIIKNNFKLSVLLFIVIVNSIFLGVIWQVYIKPCIKKRSDKIYQENHNGNSISCGGSFMTSQLGDGNDHLLCIKKGGQEIACGRFLGTSADVEERPEIALETNPTYKEWISTEPDVFSLKRTYILLQEDVIVYEYDYPKDFFENKYTGKQDEEKNNKIISLA